MVLFADDGGEVAISTKDSPAELLLVGGVPQREPVARAGPFVMNTRAEILQAFEDFQTGRF
jgi:hypothetical protein